MCDAWEVVVDYFFNYAVSSFVGLDENAYLPRTTGKKIGKQDGDHNDDIIPALSRSFA